MLAPLCAPPEESESRPARSEGQHGFLRLLPEIERRARTAFAALSPERREDAIQEVIANALVHYSRLAEQGRTELASPGALTRFAVAQFHAGRRVGSRLNARDIASRRCQRLYRLQRQPLHIWDEEEQAWRDMAVEDRRASPAELAAFRVDFAAWLKGLSRRNRRLVLALARGEGTGRVARLFRLSAGRVSQLRREFADSWNRFHAPPAASPGGT